MRGYMGTEMARAGSGMRQAEGSLQAAIKEAAIKQGALHNLCFLTALPACHCAFCLGAESKSERTGAAAFASYPPLQYLS